jgi:hypothetical protein
MERKGVEIGDLVSVYYWSVAVVHIPDSDPDL